MGSPNFNLFSLSEKVEVLHYSWVAFFITFVVWFNHAPLLGLIAQSLDLNKEVNQDLRNIAYGATSLLLLTEKVCLLIWIELCQKH